MRIGFTGTRDGMTANQKDWLRKFFILFAESAHPGLNEFHHGGARGADVEAAVIARAFFDPAMVHAHPPERGESPLVRNRAIVAVSDVLIAAPKTDREVLRSGTWATVRYARDAGKPIVFLSRGRS